jgi:hypothetical protein
MAKLRLCSDLDAAELERFVRSEPGRVLFGHFAGMIEDRRQAIEGDLHEPGLSRVRGELQMLRAMIAAPQMLLDDWQQRNPRKSIQEDDES